MHDEEIKQRKPNDYALGGDHLIHPSFGLVAVSRQQTNRKEQLFGSNTNSNSIISIKISNAEVRQDLGRNWYYDTNVITEINMTTIQYAEMISSPNTSGVPCTIKRTEKLGLIKYKPIDTEAQYIRSDIEKQISKANVVNKNLLSQVKEKLSGPVKKRVTKKILLD